LGSLIDTSIFVAVERGDVVLAAALDRVDLSSGDFAIAAITVSELIHGIIRADTEARRLAREAAVESILATVPIIPFGVAEARLHGSIGGTLMKAGNAVPNNDLAIAVTALVRGYDVITRDKRSFGKVPGLSVSHW
jgi:tRNA(fMet)-specific endonuclease VapC